MTEFHYLHRGKKDRQRSSLNGGIMDDFYFLSWLVFSELSTVNVYCFDNKERKENLS